jgi:hypothetical protein
MPIIHFEPQPKNYQGVPEDDLMGESVDWRKAKVTQESIDAIIESSFMVNMQKS